MEFKRTAYDELLRWKKESAGKTALLLAGARRIGKSFLARKFGGAEYRSCLYIDFTRPAPGVVETLPVDAYDLNLLFSKLFICLRAVNRRECGITRMPSCACGWTMRGL